MIESSQEIEGMVQYVLLLLGCKGSGILLGRVISKSIRQSIMTSYLMRISVQSSMSKLVKDRRVRYNLTFHDQRPGQQPFARGRSPDCGL